MNRELGFKGAVINRELGFKGAVINRELISLYIDDHLKLPLQSL